MFLFCSIISFLFAAGVWQSISSRDRWITWLACSSRVTTCSTSAMCGPSSACNRSTSTLNRSQAAISSTVLMNYISNICQFSIIQLTDRWQLNHLKMLDLPPPEKIQASSQKMGFLATWLQTGGKWHPSLLPTLPVIKPESQWDRYLTAELQRVEQAATWCSLTFKFWQSLLSVLIICEYSDCAFAMSFWNKNKIDGWWGFNISYFF